MIKKLSIIFPLFNEEKRLKKTFLEIVNFKKKAKNRKIEIIFVDDGSDDKSKLLIHNFINKIKSKKFILKYYKLKKNMGKGFALKFGVQRSSMPWILTTDIDLSVPLSQVIKWEKLKFARTKNVIFGSRNLENSKVDKKLTRYILGKIFNFFVSKILNINLSDTQCGFKLYNSKIAKKIFSKLTNFGFTHDLELVILFQIEGVKIIELPVKWTHKMGSKLNILIEPIKMFLNILYLKFKYL